MKKKLLKYVTSCLVLVFMITNTNSSKVFALDGKQVHDIPQILNKEKLDENLVDKTLVKTHAIPSFMLPYSRIEFLTESVFQILNGGLTEESFDIYQFERIPSVIYENPIKPYKGLIVQYASDGLIFDYNDDVFDSNTFVIDERVDNLNYFSNNILNDSNMAHISNCEELTLLYSWGSYPNQLFKCKHVTELNKVSQSANTVTWYTIIGEGRATTFNDSIGQANIVLKKGDVATKLAYDNVKVGTKLSVTATKKTGGLKTVVMTKNDAGSMPNAVLDIWKTGVEYWGYTYSTYFSMPGIVTYSRMYNP